MPDGIKHSLYMASTIHSILTRDLLSHPFWVRGASKTNELHCIVTLGNAGQP